MHVLVVMGTRPEAIKMAPVIQELKRRGGGFRVSVCLTAQHRDLLDQAIAAFDIEVQYDLDLMQHDQNPSDVAQAVLGGMRGLLTAARPDVVLVQGDTTTAFAVALAA